MSLTKKKYKNSSESLVKHYSRANKSDNQNIFQNEKATTVQQQQKRKFNTRN